MKQCDKGRQHSNPWQMLAVSVIKVRVGKEDGVWLSLAEAGRKGVGRREDSEKVFFVRV